MSFGPEMALALLMLIPLAAAGLIPLVGPRSPNLREGITFVAGVLLLLNVIYLCGLVAGGERPELLIGSFSGMFEIKF
ncbi:MAG: monovalent cation/H+ antiporter subunit D family protein, partial [Pseudomonadota bacterium]